MTNQTFKNTYNDIRRKIKEEFNIPNIYMVPEIKKIVINVGVGEAVVNKKALDLVKEQITLISGQTAVITKARSSVAAFKIRKGYPIGVKVTLRSKQMFMFLEKLIRIVLPRIRDFKGLQDSSIDSNGNMNIGLREQTLFPEIEYDTIDRIRGLEITLVITGKNREVSKALMMKLGIPFIK